LPCKDRVPITPIFTTVNRCRIIESRTS